MKVVMISCWNYRDAWKPFFALLEKFWPDHPQAWLLTDELQPGADVPDNVQVYCAPSTPRWSWCEVLAGFAREVSDEPILLFQEDFFLTSPVRMDLIQRALEQLEQKKKAGSVRLYPCPGGDTDYGDPHFAIIERGTPYRISCQATIWRPSFLLKIAERFNTTIDFELCGTPFADSLPDPVLAFKRDAQPWPLEYICTGIVRGEWNPDARRLCEQHGIDVDWSRRPFQRA